MDRENKVYKLPQPPFYFPLENGRYEIKPGLYKFPHDFGSPEHDQNVFQIDSTFSEYRQQKLAARQENLGKYYCQENYAQEDMGVINKFIVERLTREHPSLFGYSESSSGHSLIAKLTDETLFFDHDYQLVDGQLNKLSPNYVDGFDALASQVQEDMSVIKVNEKNHDRIVALHLSFPNHWAAEDKISQNFILTHRPVPHMEKMNQSAQQMMEAILHKGPYVRFAWGLATDNRLNHHPQPPTGVNPTDWTGRSFDPSQPELYLRVERQTLHGFPKARLGLFTIRTLIYDIANITAEQPSKTPLLISAIESMSESSLKYKGLLQGRWDILSWLTKLIKTK